jgi:integrase
VSAIFQAAPLEYSAFFCCVGVSGARLGELLAVRIKHIDLSNWKLRIEQSLWHEKLVPPKTVGSVRTIYFGRALADAFDGHLSRSAFKRASDFVFCKKNGSPLHPDVLRKGVLYPLLDKIGMARMPGTSGFHTFRHSAASILNQRTGNLKLAQKLLGHSIIEITADVYTHTSP